MAEGLGKCKRNVVLDLMKQLSFCKIAVFKWKSCWGFAKW